MDEVMLSWTHAEDGDGRYAGAGGADWADWARSRVIGWYSSGAPATSS